MPYEPGDLLNLERRVLESQSAWSELFDYARHQNCVRATIQARPVKPTSIMVEAPSRLRPPSYRVANSFAS